jgi:N-acetylmuramoyl-L-alanine amidase
MRIPQRQDSTIQFYSQFIKGWKIYLDPGHGGEDRYNHGPANDVIEADINLRTAIYLADYLKRAGALVYLSRDKDSTVVLSDRPKLSNASGADLFVSIHHNATGGGQDRLVNFTSVWYHAREGDAEYHASNQDIARYIQRDLAYAMGNPGSPSTFDGTLSDYMIYPNAGFAVLRMARIPAALIEGSFFSSEYEEQRLKLDEFNNIEAWGIFKGLSRYIRAGIPKLEMLTDTVFSIYRPEMVFKASDSTGIDKRLVYVKLDGKEYDAQFDPTTNLIRCTPPVELSNGLHIADVIVRNGNGNANFPFRKNIWIKPPVDSITLTVMPEKLPPSNKAMASVLVQAYDKRGQLCADGTEITLSAADGIFPASVCLLNGSSFIYYIPPEKENDIILIASADGKTAKAVISVSTSSYKFVTGVVRSAKDTLPLFDVTVTAERETVKTYPDGRFILTKETAVSNRIEIKRAGYFGISSILTSESPVIQCDYSLIPVANGVLDGKIFVIDARYGGSEKGLTIQRKDSVVKSSDLNLEIARRLQQLLTAAGATVYQVRKADFYLTDMLKAKYASNFRNALYLQIDASDTLGKVGLFIDPTAWRMNVASSILNGILETLGRDSVATQRGRTELSDGIPYGVVSVILPAVSDSLFAQSLNYGVDRCAWGIYRGLLSVNKYQEESSNWLRASSGSAPPGRKIMLDNTLTTVSAPDGSYLFYGVSGCPGVIRIVEE